MGEQERKEGRKYTPLFDQWDSYSFVTFFLLLFLLISPRFFINQSRFFLKLDAELLVIYVTIHARSKLVHTTETTALWWDKRMIARDKRKKELLNLLQHHGRGVEFGRFSKKSSSKYSPGTQPIEMVKEFDQSGGSVGSFGDDQNIGNLHSENKQGRQRGGQGRYANSPSSWVSQKTDED